MLFVWGLGSIDLWLLDLLNLVLDGFTDSLWLRICLRDTNFTQEYVGVL